MSSSQREYQAMLEDQKRRRSRNLQILSRLENIEKKAAFLQAKTDRIRSLKGIYRNQTVPTGVSEVGPSNVRIPSTDHYYTPQYGGYSSYEPRQEYVHEPIHLTLQRNQPANQQNNQPTPIYTLTNITLDEAIKEISKRFILIPKKSEYKQDTNDNEPPKYDNNKDYTPLHTTKDEPVSKIETRTTFDPKTLDILDTPKFVDRDSTDFKADEYPIKNENLFEKERFVCDDKEDVDAIETEKTNENVKLKESVEKVDVESDPIEDKSKEEVLECENEKTVEAPSRRNLVFEKQSSFTLIDNTSLDSKPCAQDDADEGVEYNVTKNKTTVEDVSLENDVQSTKQIDDHVELNAEVGDEQYANQDGNLNEQEYAQYDYNQENIAYDQQNVEYDPSQQQDLEYDPNQQQNLEYDPNQQQNLEYDPNQQQNLEYDPNQQQNLEYDPNQQQNLEYDPNQQQNLEYDPNQQQNLEYDPNQQQNLEYDPNQQQNLEYDPTQQNLEYDPSQPQNVEYESNQQQNVEYDPNQQQNAEYDPNQQQYYYEGQEVPDGQTVQEHNPEADTEYVEYQHTDYVNQQETYDSSQALSGDNTENYYNESGAVDGQNFSQYDESGISSSQGYDEQGNVNYTEQQDPAQYYQNTAEENASNSDVIQDSQYYEDPNSGQIESEHANQPDSSAQPLKILESDTENIASVAEDPSKESDFDFSEKQ